MRDRVPGILSLKEDCLKENSTLIKNPILKQEPFVLDIVLLLMDKRQKHSMWRYGEGQEQIPINPVPRIRVVGMENQIISEFKLKAAWLALLFGPKHYPSSGKCQFYILSAHIQSRHIHPVLAKK